jgi:hypothetical protein
VFGFAVGGSLHVVFEALASAWGEGPVENFDLVHAVSISVVFPLLVEIAGVGTRSFFYLYKFPWE